MEQAAPNQLTRLDSDQWFEAIANNETARSIISRLKKYEPSAWTTRLINVVEQGFKSLEVGSGTGEMSLFLAKKGVEVTLLDFSESCLQLAKECSREVNVEISTVNANYETHLPFAERAFDLVFSSGVLEHYTFDDQVKWLKEQSRVSSRYVVSIVPNASSIAYRLGKQRMENEGEWKYGVETPMVSQISTFNAAGIRVLSEETIGAAHALKFLHRRDRFRTVMQKLIDCEGEDTFNRWGQGYLLFTIGMVAR